MPEHIRILCLEDLSSDAALAEYEIRKTLKDFELRVVENEKDFVSLLTGFRPHIVISDYLLPSYDGLSALKEVIGRTPQVPVIILTGSMNEDTAVECMKAGATDYVIKEHIKRLGPAIINALEQGRIKIQKEEASRQLELNEAKYRYMFANNPQPMWIYDLETLAFLEVNDAAVIHYGYTRDEFLNMTLMDIRPKEDIPALLDDIEQTKVVFNSAKVWRHIKKNGDIIFVEIVSHGVMFGNRSARHVLVKDITVEREAKNALSSSEERFRNIFHDNICVMLLIDPESGRITDVNKAAEEFYGWPREEFLNKRIQEINTLRDDLAPEIKKALSRNQTRFEFQHLKADGLLRDVEVFSSRIEIEGRTALHSIVHDITDKKALHRNLMEAKEKAEENDRLKTAFLHNISHEIRTPLNAIIGFSGFLDLPDITPEDRKKYIQIISQSNNQLLSIINDILNISQIETSQVSVRENSTDILKVMRTLHSQFSEKAVSGNLEFRLRLPPEGSTHIIVTDETKLIQIISNLLGNAFKFTSEGYVEMGYERKEKEALFYVEDSGIGIHPSEHDRIFERFYQIDKTVSRLYSGTGLGLSISDAYVKLLGGKLSLISEPGKGSRFSFTIPLKSRPEEHVDAGLLPGQAALQKSWTILVAEDEESNFALINAILKPCGYILIRASNGSQAVDICKSDKEIDLVLMDIKMPVLDGFSAASEILKLRPGLPVIAQTAFAHPEDRTRAIGIGCVDYLAKPYDRRQLIEVISRYLK